MNTMQVGQMGIVVGVVVQGVRGGRHERRGGLGAARRRRRRALG